MWFKNILLDYLIINIKRPNNNIKTVNMQK